MTAPATPNAAIQHVPVLLHQAMAFLSPRAGDYFIDGTLGGGGYSRFLLAAGAHVLAIDQDPDVATIAAQLKDEHPRHFTFVRSNYSDLATHATRIFPSRPVDGVVLDIGVSSMQLDNKERGFSFRRCGPLDMRMAKSGPSAGDAVNTLPQESLRRIIATYGEEPRARAIAAAIVAARADKPLQTTKDLADIVARVVRSCGARHHPATRTFQALRIFVNNELEHLAKALVAAEGILRAGGRLVVMTFHSLEDRIVKRFFSSRSRPAAISRHEPVLQALAPSFRRLTPRSVTPLAQELSVNRRARSARLRAGVRTDAPALAVDMPGLGVPQLNLDQVRA